ncbi:hypothetical protein NQ318_010812 [Aromia moschata]|uniref:Mos1 transposase HTH domain-containing protein n=1 Tax=Aromia moschata TaxID=1265417 RepID=A0AAV8YJ02_9CUCU|nr:hypothetical protein NQ318_010812 [Aromia moschata]
MSSLSEQRAAVKCCVLLGKDAAETVIMLKTAYKDDAMGKTQVYEWFARFKALLATCRLMKPCSGRPSTARNDENVEKIRELVPTDRRQIIDQLSEKSGLSWSSVQRILTEDLGMKRVAAKYDKNGKKYDKQQQNIKK